MPGKRHKRPYSPVSPIMGYRVNPKTRKLVPITKSQYRIMRGKRLQTRLNKLPPGITDESEYYSDIDTPDMLLGLRGHIADLETQMSADEIANNRLAEYS